MKLVLASMVILSGLFSTGVYAATVEARIDISEQQMKVYQNGLLLHIWKISTARRGYITPIGNYKPIRMHKMWYSRKYHMSPMPHSIFFKGGYAVHGTDEIRNLGNPASHGCVRLHPDNARTLYRMVENVGRSNTAITVRH